MVRVIKNTDERTPDLVTSKLFMSSVKSWYNEDGIAMTVERISDLFENKNNPSKRGVAVTLNIEDDMPKCRARVLDLQGKVSKIEDEVTGELRDEIEIIAHPSDVTFFYNVKLEDEDLGEFSVSPLSSPFNLFNQAFIATGDLPENNNKGFIASIDELKEALIGFCFKATVEDVRFKGGKPYQRLVVKPEYDVELVGE